MLRLHVFSKVAVLFYSGMLVVTIPLAQWRGHIPHWLAWETFPRDLALGVLAGAKVEQPEGYPGWKPNLASPLLAVTRQSYFEAFGSEAELLAIHAGLECGLLTEKYPDLDIVSFGPNIRGAHSPDEKVEIASVQKIWKLFTATVTRLAQA